MQYKVWFYRHMRGCLEVNVYADSAQNAVNAAYNKVLEYFTLDELGITLTLVRSNELPLAA